jgi:hypothetical protein
MTIKPMAIRYQSNILKLLLATKRSKNLMAMSADINAVTNSTANLGKSFTDSNCQIFLIGHSRSQQR